MHSESLLFGMVIGFVVAWVSVFLCHVAQGAGAL